MPYTPTIIVSARMRDRVDSRRLYACFVSVLAAVILLVSPDGTLAGRSRVCQRQEQAFLQIKATATTLQLNNLLFSTAKSGCITAARKLLEAGASLKARDRSGSMPLSRAAESGRENIVALFLEHKASIDARNLDGSTALFTAAEAGQNDVVETLITHGADVDAPGRNGISSLAAAAYTGRADLVEFLLDHGADPTAVDATGKTAICYAAGRGFPKVVRLLLDRGVDPNRRYGNDLTALMWGAGYSAEAGTEDIAEVLAMLINRGARLDDKDNRGRTALKIAASLGHAAAVDLLIKRGANIGARDKTGHSAFELAATNELRRRLSASKQQRQSSDAPTHLSSRDKR